MPWISSKSGTRTEGGISVDCTGCIHKKICELWGNAEGQDASCYSDNCKETMKDILGDCYDLARAEAAEARTEKAERERDAAIKELDGVSSAVDDLAEFIDDQIYPMVSYDLYTALRDNTDAISTWQYEAEWRGPKKED